ncbi:hypothetical protein N8843_07130 [Verrucomicrobia bacterium]|jgi:hypothetical protein|nr:hypothetical protein [Verrucomicrobiota bacterium]MBT4274040.1 hypothetical protein [Verrucomicrobiota bacterium]MBT5064228.1 hypothetical protein [Verrucomicrobiota bacterium]MBT5477612.1 hypothetical protein [Verrucomicrobiota bacterium]MBT6237787.1 hypothetical protein [Verrucomicrobiota bacterium]
MSEIKNGNQTYSWPDDWVVEVRRRSPKRRKTHSRLKYPWLRYRDGKTIVVVEEITDTD